MKIIIRKSEKSVNFEREILSKLHNKFIVNMYYAFQDKDNLYLVMDYLKGGDLRFHLTRHIRFSEEQSRFFICNIITALEYIHSKNIIHRDIKPENLVLEEEGYARLTDFGIAKKNIDDNKGDTSGTPGYMAPEVMRGAAHSFEVDFFALGIIGYEFMKGKRPYCGKNRKEIREEMLMRQIFIKNEEIEDGWTKESVDFINKLLIRKKENRLGYKGIAEVKDHPWIKYYPWTMIIDKTLPSPFIPQNKDNFDLRYCAKTEKIGEETKMRYEELMLDNKFKNVFKNFIFNYDNEQKLLLKNKENNGSNLSKKVISNIYNRVNKYNFDLNSLNEIYNNKASYKQLPNSNNNNNKIIIDIAKDKYNTINELNNINSKKIDINNAETIYGTIFKKENMKLNKLFEEKLKNKYKKKVKSNSNLSSNHNKNNMNISLNNKIYHRRINISGILSPARSDKYLLNNNNNKRDNSSKVINKNQKQKSLIFNSNYDLNLIAKSPSNQNNIDKKQIFHNFNKYATLLSKSNSYKAKNSGDSKNKSSNKIIYNQNKKNHNSNLPSNLIPSQIKKNIVEKKKYYKGLTHFRDITNTNNNEIQSPIMYINGKNINKSKSRMYGNETIILKNKISMTSNYNSNTNNLKNINKQNNICKNNSNKTFLNEYKIRKNSSLKSKEDLLINEKNNNHCSKKKIFINNSKININDSIKNLIKYNSKYKSLKEIDLNNQQNIIKPNNANNPNNNLNIDKNSFDKENINSNLINNFIKRKMININDDKKERILVNKRNNNKTIGNDTEKNKYILNNYSINNSKNAIKNKIMKSKTNFSTLNNSSFKNSKLIKEKTNEKDNYLSYRNIVMSYKQKQNYSGK